MKIRKSMWKQLKSKLLILYFLCVIFQIVIGPNNFDASLLEIIVGPLFLLIIFLLIPLTVGFLTHIISKDKDKTLSMIKGCLNVTFVILAIGIFSTAWVYLKYGA
tara:strand:- start:133 stop:447 length:315 start_codon:yes stop_codon:yes gene_type:complete